MNLFNSCTQNSFAVASIIEYLLKTLKKEYPVLNQAFLRSDNAGCYNEHFFSAFRRYDKRTLDIDIAIISETHLNNKIPDSVVGIENYSLANCLTNKPELLKSPYYKNMIKTDLEV